MSWRDKAKQQVGSNATWWTLDQGDHPHRLLPSIKGWKENSDIPPVVIYSRHYVNYGEFKGFVTCGYDEVLGSNGNGCRVCDELLPELTARLLTNGKPDIQAQKLAEQCKVQKVGVCCVSPIVNDEHTAGKPFSFNINGPGSWGSKYISAIMDHPGDPCHPASGIVINVNKTGKGMTGPNKTRYEVSVVPNFPAIPKVLFSQRPELEITAYSDDLAQLAADGSAWSKEATVTKYTVDALPSSPTDDAGEYEDYSDPGGEVQDEPVDESTDAAEETPDYSSWDDPPAEEGLTTVEVEVEEAAEVPAPPVVNTPPQRTAPKPVAPPPPARKTVAPPPSARKTVAPPPPPARKTAAPPPPARKTAPPPPPRGR
jgi:hypothetical protein